MAKALLQNYTLILTAIVFLLPGMACAQEKPLQSPYPPSWTVAAAPEPVPCKKPPKSIRDLEFTSVYTDRSDGVSHVDDDALERYNNAVEPLRKFERYVHSRVKTGHGNCAAAWLYRWASGEALLGTVNAQGRAVRKWTLASLASAYLQIRDDPAIPMAQKRIIKAWLSLVAQTVRNDYSIEKDLPSLHNNHLYWAAWATMITAVVTNDRDLFDWSVAQYHIGAGDIGPDGTLPHEIKRMGKAMNYHVFSAGPLVMMAETAQANGLDLYGAHNGALHRLVDRIMTELETNQTYMTRKTGTPQDMEGTVSGSALAWLEPYARRFPDARYDRWFQTLRPMVQRRLGGDMTALYIPSSMPADIDGHGSAGDIGKLE